MTGAFHGCGAPSTKIEAPAEPAVVTSFSPDGVTDDPDEPIRIQFDQPMVGESKVGSSLDHPPVRLVPEADLAALWEDRQTLVVRPLEELKPSTRYDVRFTGRLADRVSEGDYSFVYLPLAVAEHFGVDLHQAPVKPRIGIRFNQPVKAEDAERGCHIEEQDTGRLIDVTTADPELTGAEMVLVPAETLEQGRDYVVRCETLSGAGGDVEMDEPYEVELHTYPLFEIVSFEPSGKDVWSDEVDIDIVFANPVEEEELRDALRIKPATVGFERGTLDRSGTTFTVKLDLKSSTQYRVKVASSLKDVFGQAIEGDKSFEFTTGQARPRLVMETGIFAVESEKKSGYPVWTRNLSRFDVECARVPQKRVVKLLTGSMNYDPWYDAGEDNVDWKGLGLKRRTKHMRVKDAKDKWQLSDLELGRICGGKGRKGLFLAEIESEQVEPDPDHYWRYRPQQRVLANVTDLGLLLKAGSASGILWVTSLASGEPVGGAAVAVYTPRGRKAFSGTTDKDGILRLPGADRLLRQPGAGDKDAFEEYAYEEYDMWRSKRLIVVVEKGDDMAVVDGNWANGIQIWNFGVPVDYKGGETRYRGFILSDRGIYRPGETVHFKGLIRQVGIGKPPTVPAGARVSITVEDPRGSTVYNRRHRLSEFGGFDFDLKVGKEANLGDYYVTARIKDQAFRETFMVEEFRKVAYEIDLDSGERHTRLGKRIKLKLDANYLFGAPVTDADVEWSVMRRAHTVRFPRLREYTFSDDAAEGRYYYWWDYDRYQYMDFVSDGVGRTDKRGNFRFVVRDEAQDLSGPQDYIVQVTVNDQAGDSVSKRAAITAHRSDIYVGLHSQEWVQAVGMPFSVNTVAVSPDGKRVAAKGTLSYVRQRQKCEYSKGYRAYPSCKTVHEKIWSRRIDIPRTGSGTERIMPKEPGEYVIRVEGEDSRGNKVAASSFVWVLGKGEAFWSGDESARMTLMTSKSEYEPGEKARLAPRTSLGRGTALVTLERDGIIDAFVKRMDSSGEGIDIPIEDAHAPNVFASVAMVKGRTGEGDRHRPRFQMGVTEIKVSTVKRRLEVELTTEQEKYEPGEKVRGQVQVSVGGKPVRSEVCISVADEGVLQLIAYKTPDPMKTFYKAFGLGVESSTNLNRIARLNDPREIDPDEGGDSGDGGGPEIRSRFVSSAFWVPSLVTNSKGQASFEFDAPENLTAFRLMAVAADKGSKFGSGEGRITVTKPLLARPLLPRFVSTGDKLQVGVEVQNLTDAAGQAEVTAKFRGVKLKGKRTKKVGVGAHGTARVRFPVEVGLARKASFTYTVEMNGRSDGIKVTIPIGRPLTIEKETLARGRTDGSVEVAIDWPDDLLEQESRLEVTVDRTGMAELGPGLKYLIEYPYGCLEQTLSRFIPLTKVEDLAKSLKLKDLRGPKLRQFIRSGVAKVIRHQHQDGHFSLWPGGTTYPHLTVYAVYGLGEAKRAGVKVDADALARGTRAIRQWANSKDRVVDSGGQAGTMAMAAYVLAELGQAEPGLNSRLYEQRRGLTVYGKAFLLSALKISGAPKKQVSTLKDELLDKLVRKGGTALVRETGGLRGFMSSDVRSSAIVLSALMRVDPDNEAVDELADGLRSEQRPGGYWYNTQANLYALVALADYARGQQAGKLNVKVTLGGRKLTERKLSGHKVLSYNKSLDKLDPGDLVIEPDGAARYAVRLVQASMDDRGHGVDRGFELEREYLDPETGDPLTKFAVGDMVRVKVKVKTEKDRHYVAVVDPLPAGFEPINTRLATSAQGYEDTSPRDRYYDWWRPGWTHTELRDDRVLAFADLMRDGTLVLEYLARAISPGSFTAAPATAEAMYQPDVNGRTAAQKVEVKK
jgi:uncharacterized protein YfaS (alpha-2-macroglobulin family)